MNRRVTKRWLGKLPFALLCAQLCVIAAPWVADTRSGALREMSGFELMYWLPSMALSLVDNPALYLSIILLAAGPAVVSVVSVLRCAEVITGAGVACRVMSILVGAIIAVGLMAVVGSETIELRWGMLAYVVIPFLGVPVVERC